MTSYKELFKLYDIIENGQASTVENFLQNNTLNINEIIPCKGIGVLHLAVGIEPIEKSLQCTEILLKHGADPNLCSDDGMTPLHIASIWGRVENIKLLIGCSGDPSKQDFEGLSAFDYAAREQQWEVFDYLHNVVDELEDSIGSQCAYSLDLDKILVTTNQVVAEYGMPANNCQQSDAYRKSDLIREWCDKTTLIMNKLYPTILTETHEPNMTLDETKTFKSCFSSKIKPNDLCISGIKLLDETVANKTCTCKGNDTKKRFSVYENFSLPGSPTNITHKNYNTKTNLKICKLVNENGFNDDVAMEQNKTNELLSSSSKSDFEYNMNTRRSSASSGVSSSFSNGSIALATVNEEYKYEDKEEDVVLIEKRLLLSPIVIPIEDEASAASELEKTILSVASSLPTSVEYDNQTLRKELIKRGFKPGPIDHSTRTLYLKKLHSLRKNPILICNSQGKTYSIELEKSLKSDEWTKDLSLYMALENKARADFNKINKKWREGTAKTSFTYLLLDPRMTDNLPARANKQSQHESWITFINSIFYVGKGKRSRPYSHLYQALTLWKRDFTASKDKKVQHILDIWNEKVGVVCLHIFQNVIPAEAYTYEAAMIDVLGVANLKNLKGGNYYGVASNWPLKERRMLGLYLLYKAMLIFLSEGERQLRPDDID